MKQCTRCSNTLTADAAYCNICNTDQNAGFEEFEPKPTYSATFLKVLCILTIGGSVINFISSVKSLMRGSVYTMQDMEVITYAGLVITVSKLVGAVLMMQKKLKGLYIYTVGAILGLIMFIYTISLKWEYMESVADSNDAIIVGSTGLALLITIAFPIMYWLPVNKRLLS